MGTGGYASEISSHIIKAIIGISAEITTQYVLRYTPDFDRDAKPKEYRHIKVDIPSMPWIKPLTRDGYYPERVARRGRRSGAGAAGRECARRPPGSRIAIGPVRRSGFRRSVPAAS